MVQRGERCAFAFFRQPIILPVINKKLWTRGTCAHRKPEINPISAKLSRLVQVGMESSAPRMLFQRFNLLSTPSFGFDAKESAPPREHIETFQGWMIGWHRVSCGIDCYITSALLLLILFF